MLTPEQAMQLREAGLTAYNHNLDTSPEYYGKITTTRKYEDRLSTLAAVRDAGGCKLVRAGVPSTGGTGGAPACMT
jgi:biotin synthase-like enzyme